MSKDEISVLFGARDPDRVYAAGLRPKPDLWIGAEWESFKYVWWYGSVSSGTIVFVADTDADGASKFKRPVADRMAILSSAHTLLGAGMPGCIINIIIIRGIGKAKADGEPLLAQ